SAEPRSPADKAGIKTGDIIIGVDGQTIENSIELPRVIGDSRPGTQVKLKIWRQGETREISASLGEMPSEKLASADTSGGKPMKPSKLGVAVRPLTQEERTQIASDGGLLVEQADGPAARAGVQAGDVILAVTNHALESGDQL